ncbi:MAG: hypothetical protein ACRD3A_05480 [Terriglobales bacterium]
MSVGRRLDDQVAPDFTRTVDIHRKPGYDPVELFLDPALRAPWRGRIRREQRHLGVLDPPNTRHESTERGNGP